MLVAVFLFRKIMSVEITTGTWIGGMPTFDYKIHINGIAISIQKEDFLQLTKSLDEEISNNLEKALEVKEKYEQAKAEKKRIQKELRQQQAAKVKEWKKAYKSK